MMTQLLYWRLIYIVLLTRDAMQSYAERDCAVLIQFRLYVTLWCRVKTAKRIVKTFQHMAPS